MAARIDVQVDSDARLLRITLSGTVTFADLTQLEADLRKCPEYRLGYSVLTDATGVREMRLHGDEVYFLAEQTESNRNYVAIVASDPMTVGLARIYATAANWRTDRVSVFSDLDGAIVWLAERARA